MNLLALSNAGELHSYIDLPERHECPAFGQNILHLDNIFCTVEKCPASVAWLEQCLVLLVMNGSPESCGYY
jgi:hypothetical protein